MSSKNEKLQSNALHSKQQKVISRLWKQYRGKVADAQTIQQTISDMKDNWIEDHIAFRSIPGEKTGAHVLQAAFESIGYERMDDYFFEEKQLKAFWMAPIGADEAEESDVVSPKVFISEIITEKFSSEFQNILDRCQKDAEPKYSADDFKTKDIEAHEIADFLNGGICWPKISKNEHALLVKESEYAGWTSVFGNQPNHFTLSVHLMSEFDSIQELVTFIQDKMQIPLNESGGIVKGTMEVGLEQISTIAKSLPVQLSDGELNLPYAFIEFAFRWPLKNCEDNGVWSSYYQGFVVANADKIFESTNTK